MHKFQSCIDIHQMFPLKHIRRRYDVVTKVWVCGIQSTRAGQRHTHGLQIDYSLMSSIVLLQHVQHALPSLHQQAEVRRLAQTLAHNHSNSQQNNLRQFAAELDTLEEVSSMHSSVSSAGSAPMMFEFSNPAEFANAGRSANPTADACCHAQ